MNVFDFDDTIYDGDSSIDFFKYCLQQNKKLLKYLPHIFLSWIKFQLKIISVKQFKESFFSFIRTIELDSTVERFWKKQSSKIKNWYLMIRNENDVIISSSPDFLIKPICEYLGVHQISTIFDTEKCVIIGNNCKGEEKVERFQKEYPGIIPESFYSDSNTDSPLANYSKKAFKVRGDQISEWLDIKNK